MSRHELETIRSVDEDVGIEWISGYRSEDGTFVKHGPYRLTTNDERLIEEGPFSHGFRHGKWSTYHENGRLSTVCEYKDGELHGRQTTWFDDGTVESETDFCENVNHGILRHYHSNGQVKEESRYIDGERSGPCTVYDDDGSQLAHGTYLDDLPRDGTFMVYDEVVPSEALPAFTDYVNAILERGFAIVEFRDGEPIGWKTS